MVGILADINVQGHLNFLLHVWESKDWREIWESLSLSIHTFEDFGLNKNTSDKALWEECQNRKIALITANRNDDGPDSLEATIRNQNNPNSLPVFTLGDADRVFEDKGYAARTAIQLLQYFLDIDSVLGTGRLFVP